MLTADRLSGNESIVKSDINKLAENIDELMLILIIHHYPCGPCVDHGISHRRLEAHTSHAGSDHRQRPVERARNSVRDDLIET